MIDDCTKQTPPAGEPTYPDLLVPTFPVSHARVVAWVASLTPVQLASLGLRRVAEEAGWAKGGIDVERCRFCDGTGILLANATGVIVSGAASGADSAVRTLSRPADDPRPEPVREHCIVCDSTDAIAHYYHPPEWELAQQRNEARAEVAALRARVAELEEGKARGHKYRDKMQAQLAEATRERDEANAQAIEQLGRAASGEHRADLMLEELATIRKAAQAVLDWMSPFGDEDVWRALQDALDRTATKENTMGDVLELVSEAVHDEWMRNKRAAGVESRKLDTTGEELLVPYAQLSETAKDLDRGSVRATLGALEKLGFKVERATT